MGRIAPLYVILNVRKDTNMFKAGVPYIKDIPDDMNVIHIDEYDEYGPFGSSGASEAYQSGGHMAVINAIYNACGVRIHELPATAEKVKAGIEALTKGESNPNIPEKYYLGSDFYTEIKNIIDNPIVNWNDQTNTCD